MFKRPKKGLLATSLAFLTLFGCSNPQDVTQVREENLASDLYGVYCRAEVPDHCVTLDEILCIALDRNLDLLVKQWEYAVQYEVATRETLKMIPGLIFSGEHSYRNRNTASSSESLVSGVPPAPLSISSVQNVARWDVTGIWNLLDFGVSYYRSRQEVDRALMKCLEYERLRQNLVSDVVRNYWKAIAAKYAIDQSITVIERSIQQRGLLQSEMDKKIITSIQGLRNQNQLLNIQIQLQAYQREYHAAIAELTQRMGLPPCTTICLAEVCEFPTELDLCDICELEMTALRNRPELYSGDTEEMIWVNEVYAEILQMLPGLSLFYGTYYDNNRFLLFNNWLYMGARASWNLFSIPQHWVASEVAVERQGLTQASRMALSVAIVTQVRLAYLVYFDNRDQYLLAKELEVVNRKMLNAANDERKQGKLNEADILRYEAEALFSGINARKAYADMQDSLEKLNNALGMPRYFQNHMATGPVRFTAYPDTLAAPVPVGDLAAIPDVTSTKQTPLPQPVKEEPKAPEIPYYEPPVQQVQAQPAPAAQPVQPVKPAQPVQPAPQPAGKSSMDSGAPDFSDVPRSFREDFPDMRKVDNPFDRRGPYNAPSPNLRGDNTQSTKGNSVADNSRGSSNGNTFNYTGNSQDSDDEEQKRLDRELEKLLNS